MRYSINLPNFGELSDPRTVADLAAAAEAAGWDGFFLWDHINHGGFSGRPFGDPWILLAAAGLATSRIKLGPLVTPVARRRPAKLAREITTLDTLTAGRLILGVGLGAPIDDEFGSFGEPTDLKILGRRLDESLDALSLLLSGKPGSYRGEHIIVDNVQFVPECHVPIWVAGRWPTRAPFRRAARWDAAVPLFPGYREQTPPAPEDVRDMVAFLTECRAENGRSSTPFEVVVGGRTGENGAEVVAALADAGATWWDERMPFDDALDKADTYRRRIEQGPPRQ
jgi:alkanesulfonate monooxygenase SsuD/methylene tetrahydromethanopterin reductase-like flavin-dependent oxidoreductase (luciferase family)